MAARLMIVPRIGKVEFEVVRFATVSWMKAVISGPK